MVTIRLDGVQKTFGDSFIAVDNLSLSFEEGSTTCLLGPSGCGKTTLMRMIAGLERPTTGRIFFGDIDVTNLKPRERNLGMVFQYPVVYRGTSVRENIALPLRREGMTRTEKMDRVDEVLEVLGLGEVAEKDVSQLDNASRQKVAVARSIARRPPIVLFDEPITNVDIHAKLHLKRVLKEVFTRLSQTVLYVTHDQTEAMTLADNIALMQSGRIEQLAPPRTLYDRADSVFAGWFLGNPGMNFIELGEGNPMVRHLVGAKFSSEVTTVGFRPEDVQISGTTGEGPALKVRLDHVSIAAGGQKQLSLVYNGQPLKAKLPANAAVPIAVGADAWISVPEARLRLFDADQRAMSETAPWPLASL